MASRVPCENSHVSDDTVFYALYPDSSLSSSSLLEISSLLEEVVGSISPFLDDYIWQHEPFHLSICWNPISHFHGKTHFGYNLEDEWFIVYILFHISRAFPSLTIQVHDSDGQFLLIEAAYFLPRWLNPETSQNRVFLRRGSLHIISRKQFPSSPLLLDALMFLSRKADHTCASESVQASITRKIADYPDRAQRNMHRVTVRVPLSVAWILKNEPGLISLAVEGFYDRDIDSMKFAAKMEKFLERGKNEEMERISARMPRTMYAQLVQQKFQAPKCYPMPKKGDKLTDYTEAELGMKIACGFEMMYQTRKKMVSEGKGSTWEVFKENLESSRYFKGLLSGSREYRQLMENAEVCYRRSVLFSRASEMMNAPVRRIDEILDLPHSLCHFRDHELPPPDDDTWLYNGEAELNSVLQERQKEMEIYDSLRRKDGKTCNTDSTLSSFGTQLHDFDGGDIAESMQAFVDKVSSFKGAEVPENSVVSLNVGRFIDDMESFCGSIRKDGDGTYAGSDGESASTSDIDVGESDTEEADDIVDDAFMRSYSDALNRELMENSLQRSVSADEKMSSYLEGREISDRLESKEELTEVDIDVNLVKNLLDSVSSQQGLPGPASNLLGLMGLQLPYKLEARK